ncbi:MAG: DUF4116 domain-containing protein [Ruminococcus sp.]
MSERAKTYEEAAVECASKLTDEQKEYFQLYLSYTYHHFSYGLYLRNHYSYLLSDDSVFFGRFIRDDIGSKIYYLMLPVVFPEFKGHEKYIERITEKPFDNLNANYYLKYGRNFIEDITPESYFVSLKGTEGKDKKSDDWWEKYLSENNEYATAIAEHIWNYDSFKETAIALGYDLNEIKEVHQFCIDLLKKKEFFVPLEILFAKNPTSASMKEFMKNQKLIEWLFSENESYIELLPSYIFTNRDVAILMVTSRGQLLELVPGYSNDYDVVLAAVKNTPYAMEYADKSLWGDYSIAEEAARNSEYCLMFSIEAFQQFNDDDHIVKLALEANGANICYASDRIKSDYNMAVFALQHQKNIYPNSAYPSLSEELRKRKDLALIELHAPLPSLDGFDQALLDDDEIAELIFADEDNRYLIHNMSERIQRKYTST